MPEKEVLNSEEAAEFLGFSAYTIREYAKRGVIPGKKIGKEWRFYRPALVGWLTGNKPEQNNTKRTSLAGKNSNEVEKS